MWMRPIMYETMTYHVRGKGLPFTDLLETLLAVKLGPQALTIDVRIKREKELEHIFEWGASVRAQAMCRGMLARIHSRRKKAERSGMPPPEDTGRVEEVVSSSD